MMKSLSVQDFLNLMTAQMRYQDPLNPQNDTQFMSQLSQLTSVQELKDLNTQTAYNSREQAVTQASTMIGKVIEGTSASSGDKVAGIVTEVRSDGTSTLLIIPGDAVDVADVTRAYDASAVSGPTQADLEHAVSLVGKTVFGVMTDGSVSGGTVQTISTDGGNLAFTIAIPGQNGAASTTGTMYYADMLSYEGVDASGSLSQSSWLVGHTVKAVDPDSTSDPKGTFTGMVTGVRLTNGEIMLDVGTKKITLDALQKVT